VSPTQDSLYAALDLELSWSERELPERERTKHVHRLHPPRQVHPQLVEVFSARYFAHEARVYGTFVGSGTTLVEANVFGAKAVGRDISAFNCVLSRVKTARYSLGELQLALRGTLEEGRRVEPGEATPWLERWYAPRALAELLAYAAELIDPPPKPTAVVSTNAVHTQPGVARPFRLSRRRGRSLPLPGWQAQVSTNDVRG
jgi:hypothetical protein